MHARTLAGCSVAALLAVTVTAGLANGANAADATAHAEAKEIVERAGVREALEGVMNGIIAGIHGAMSSQPKELRPRLEQVSAHLEPLVEQSLAQMDPLLFVGGAATYAPTSDAELEQYINFLGSPTGTAVNEIVMQAITAATSAYVYRFGKLLAEATEGTQAL